MKKKMINKTHIEGRIYEIEIEEKTSKAGVDYIGGKLHIATDDEGLNIVPVDFPYVTPKTSKGNVNKNWDILKNIMANGKAVIDTSFEEATKIKIDSAIGVNEWYKDGDNGEKELVSSKRNENGFVHIITDLNKDETKRNTFEIDMVITNTILKEASDDYPEKLRVKGFLFNYANAIFPVEFSVLTPQGIKYFEDLDISPKTPVFTKVWGKQISETIITTKIEESAFGEAEVKESKFERKDWVITGASVVPYDFDDEGTILASEWNKCKSDREVYLSDMLQKQLEREKDNAKSKNGTFSAGANTKPKSGDFNF